jgi:hypothetical protein
VTALNVTARTTALRPAQSPPLVNTAIFIIAPNEPVYFKDLATGFSRKSGADANATAFERRKRRKHTSKLDDFLR